MLSNIIFLLHLILFIFLCSSIFIPSNKCKYYALIILLFVLGHYITNNGKCAITEIEYYIKGVNYKEGFFYRLINPVITVSPVYIDNQYYFLHILLILILCFQLKNFLFKKNIN
jgi:hypothetical protein